ncbi:helix-turn-helix domain-containing protein [Nocardia noduli]|uniref:helix-turn-helix domain-containing protein n=1 Tax=Nocardia noduli TaxID=2815722 RepID=UPI001C24A9EB|nr:helix-turn-helix transcriptional regulator [Nocardia noduli]
MFGIRDRAEVRSRREAARHARLSSEAIGIELALLRIASRTRPRVVAERAGLSVGRYREIESGGGVEDSVLEKLAVVLGSTLDEVRRNAQTRLADRALPSLSDPGGHSWMMAMGGYDDRDIADFVSREPRPASGFSVWRRRTSG